MIAPGIGNRSTQGPFIGATTAALLPVAFGSLRVACIECAPAGREEGVVAESGVWKAAPDGQCTSRIPGSFQGVGQRQATVFVAEFGGFLVIHHRFTGAFRHGASTEGAIVTGALRMTADGLLHRIALTVFRQLRQQLPACGGVDTIDQCGHALLLRRSRCR
ncbi:hypothetical protein D3C81_1059960 [compost metagenome]